MAIAVIKMKVLPVSPEIDLEKLKETIKNLIEGSEGKNCNFEEEPIAFGLKALIVFFSWPESSELESLEEKIKSIEDVSSMQIIDMRRAFGS